MMALWFDIRFLLWWEFVISDLRNKIVIVTGAGRSLCYSHAVQFAQESLSTT